MSELKPTERMVLEDENGTIQVVLPDKWTKRKMAALGSDPGYSYYNDGCMCSHSVRLLPDGSMEVTPEDCVDKFNVPWEVLHAMWLDNGIFGVKPIEGKHLPQMLAERDKLRQAVARLEQRNTYLTQLLAKANGKRKKHFALVSRLKHELYKLRRRVSRQRKANAELRAELIQLSSQTGII